MNKRPKIKILEPEESDPFRRDVLRAVIAGIVFLALPVAADAKPRGRTYGNGKKKPESGKGHGQTK